MARPSRGRTPLFALRWHSFLPRPPGSVLRGACSMLKSAAGMTLAALRGWLLQPETNRGQGELKPPDQRQPDQPEEHGGRQHHEPQRARPQRRQPPDKPADDKKQQHQRTTTETAQYATALAP